MRTVFFDVDTQLDFLYPAGALYVPGAEMIANTLAGLTRHASSNGIPVISSADAHTEDDPEFKTWKPHCVAGTFGQQKSSATLLPQAVVLSTGTGAFEEVQPRLSGARQIVVEKQQLDVFTNPHLRPLLQYFKADRYVLYGVVTELCVRCAAFGLLESGARVDLVTDAVKSLSGQDEREFLNRFTAHGGKVITAAEATGQDA